MGGTEEVGGEVVYDAQELRVGFWEPEEGVEVHVEQLGVVTVVAGVGAGSDGGTPESAPEVSHQPKENSNEKQSRKHRLNTNEKTYQSARGRGRRNGGPEGGTPGERLCQGRVRVTRRPPSQKKL
jgi:hypothetical protein